MKWMKVTTDGEKARSEIGILLENSVQTRWGRASLYT